MHEPQILRFLSGADLNADPNELRDGLDGVGLKGMDESAVIAINHASRDIFFLSLVSSKALSETLAFALRALGMIRRVALVYECRPGRLGLLYLARHMLADIALLPVGMLVAVEGAREAGSAVRGVAHVGVQAVSAAHPLAGAAVGAIGNAVSMVAEGLTPRAAEAALAAARMAHLGLLAVAHVRPVTISQSKHREMRLTIYKQILNLKRDAARSRKRAAEDILAETNNAVGSN
jgi:hypothetical protein